MLIVSEGRKQLVHLKLHVMHLRPMVSFLPLPGPVVSARHFTPLPYPQSSSEHNCCSMKSILAEATLPWAD